MGAEVWVLETEYYGEFYIETLIHIPNTNLWLLDQGWEDKEDIVDAGFDTNFFTDVDYSYALTKVGKL